MMKLWITTVILSLLAGLLYRLGGIGKPFDTKYRDLGVSFVFVAWMAILGHLNWSLVLCFGALFGALTTYNKWLGKLFHRPDPSKVYWESWLMTGLLYGLALLPYCIVQGHWVGFGIRVVVLGVLTCLWSELIGEDWLEEGGRGFLIIATLPLIGA